MNNIEIACGELLSKFVIDGDKHIFWEYLGIEDNIFEENYSLIEVSSNNKIVDLKFNDYIVKHIKDGEVLTIDLVSDIVKASVYIHFYRGKDTFTIYSVLSSEEEIKIDSISLMDQPLYQLDIVVNKEEFKTDILAISLEDFIQ